MGLQIKPKLFFEEFLRFLIVFYFVNTLNWGSLIILMFRVLISKF